MNVVSYDGSFEGLLTAVFEVYEYKIEQPSICREEIVAASLFGDIHQVHTSDEKSWRVYKKLSEKLSKTALAQLYNAFLSELRDIENILLQYIRYVIDSKLAVENDYSNITVLQVQQTSRKVRREKHRMEAFIRFQLTKDQLYYALVQPDFNVLPLISKHFKKRYADQRWLIYDSQRKYGLYYDLEKVEAVEVSFNEPGTGSSHLLTINDEKEELYQQLWRQYFTSVNIAARRNMKLHIQHMPKRYWRFLTEKQIRPYEES